MRGAATIECLGRCRTFSDIPAVTSGISTGNPRFERAAGAGTYTLAPYTIILRYSDGYQRQLGVTIKPDDMEKPALTQLFVNTYTLVRRQ